MSTARRLTASAAAAAALAARSALLPGVRPTLPAEALVKEPRLVSLAERLSEALRSGHGGGCGGGACGDATHAAEGHARLREELGRVAEIRRQRVRAPGGGGAGGGELSWTVYSFHATDPSLSDAGALAELSAVDGGALGGACSLPGLPLDAAGPLVEAALDDAGGDAFAIATLPGLCAWVAEQLARNGCGLKEEFGEEACEACMAIALGRPRPGHSVLGRGTFAAAEPAWLALAARYALAEGPTVRAHEAALYRSCGAASLAGTAFADPSPDALPESGGAVAAFAFGAATDD